MPHMYILECSDGSFYVGSTWDADYRLAQHQPIGHGAAVACAGLRRHRDGFAELKRMFVLPGFRGRGIAALLLGKEAQAHERGVTLHVETLYGDNSHHIAESCFKGLARALRTAVAIDPRAANEVPSTKGSLGG